MIFLLVMLCGHQVSRLWLLNSVLFLSWSFIWSLKSWSLFNYPILYCGLRWGLNYIICLNSEIHYDKASK